MGWQGCASGEARSRDEVRGASERRASGAKLVLGTLKHTDSANLVYVHLEKEVSLCFWTKKKPGSDRNTPGLRST